MCWFHRFWKCYTWFAKRQQFSLSACAMPYGISIASCNLSHKTLSIYLTNSHSHVLTSSPHNVSRPVIYLLQSSLSCPVFNVISKLQLELPARPAVTNSPRERYTPSPHTSRSTIPPSRAPSRSPFAPSPFLPRFTFRLRHTLRTTISPRRSTNWTPGRLCAWNANTRASYLAPDPARRETVSIFVWSHWCIELGTVC